MENKLKINIEKENNIPEVIDGFEFLSEIQKSNTVQKKFKILNNVLNQEPKIIKNLNKEIAKKSKNKEYKPANDFDYVPVSVVEECLRQIFFGQVDFVINNHQRDLNSYVVHASIMYKCPVSQTMRRVDGIGAKSIQQDAGSNIGNFNVTMKGNGLELAVGAAYSRAIKNAAKKLGKLFGADLNRDEELESIIVYSKNVVNK